MPESFLREQWPNIRNRMQKLGIRRKDLEEQFVRSPGPGGQNVNKVATCIHLIHRPTGLKVKCHRERTQAANRRRAYELLLDKYEERLRQAERQRRAVREKRRRQNRPRPQALKKRILQNKRNRSELKRSRRKVLPNDLD